MTGDTKNRIAAAIDAAEEIGDLPEAELPRKKPRLLIENCDPDRTVAALRNILSESGGLYDRGLPVRAALGNLALRLQRDIPLGIDFQRRWAIVCQELRYCMADAVAGADMARLAVAQASWRLTRCGPHRQN